MKNTLLRIESFINPFPLVSLCLCVFVVDFLLSLDHKNTEAQRHNQIMFILSGSFKLDGNILAGGGALC
jgi:hypothetical protein